MRAQWRLTCLPFPKSAESIQRHFFFLFFFSSSSNDAVCFEHWGVPLSEKQKKRKPKKDKEKPLLQCRATVNETRNISLFPEDDGVWWHR